MVPVTNGRVVKIEKGVYHVAIRDGVVKATRNKILWIRPCQIIVGDRVQVELGEDPTIVLKHRKKHIRVAILGMAADPITNGHIELGKVVGDSGFFDEVWFMPCYSHMFGKHMQYPWYRYHWCSLAVQKLPAMYLTSRYEIFHQHIGCTYDLMLRMKEDFPDFKFHWIIGYDNVLEINKWKHAEELKQGNAIPFVVAPRIGYELPPGKFWYDDLPHIHLHKSPGTSPISSTEARKLLAANNPAARNILDPDVYDDIIRNNIKFQEVMA